MTDLATITNTEPVGLPLPRVFDPRGLCPTLARIAYWSWQAEKQRQGAAWRRQLRGMEKTIRRAPPARPHR